MAADWKLWVVAPVPQGPEDRLSAFAARLGLLRHPSFSSRPGPAIDAAMAATAMAHLGHADQEHSVVFSLDEDHRLLAIHEPALGDLESVASAPRDIVKVPLLVGARSILFAHNHPSGMPAASVSDLDMNRFVRRLALGLGMEFDGAVVVGKGGRFTVDDATAVPVHRPRPRHPPVPRYEPNARRPRDRAGLGGHYGSLEGYLCRTCLVRTTGYDVESAPVIETTQDVADLVDGHVSDTNVLMIGFDAHLRVVAVHEVPDNEDAARSIAQVALAAVCSACIIAQRMSDGVRDSGRIDEMEEALSLVGVPLRDYIFCTPDGGHASALAVDRINRPDVSYVLPMEEQLEGPVAYEPVM